MMTPSASRPPELALPVASLSALCDTLVGTVGAAAAAQALRQAGYAAGDAFQRILAGADGAGVASLSAERFWQQLSRLFASRGWGQFSFSHVHPGVGALDSADWVEARPEADTLHPTCHFTTGVLANLLGSVADAEVAVLEVECRSRGDQRCRFLFGSSDAVYGVYEQVAAGERPDAAVAKLA